MDVFFDGISITLGDFIRPLWIIFFFLCLKREVWQAPCPAVQCTAPPTLTGLYNKMGFLQTFGCMDYEQVIVIFLKIFQSFIHWKPFVSWYNYAIDVYKFEALKMYFHYSWLLFLLEVILHWRENCWKGYNSHYTTFTTCVENTKYNHDHFPWKLFHMHVYIELGTTKEDIFLWFKDKNTFWPTFGGVLTWLRFHLLPVDVGPMV